MARRIPTKNSVPIAKIQKKVIWDRKREEGPPKGFIEFLMRLEELFEASRKTKGESDIGPPG